MNGARRATPLLLVVVACSRPDVSVDSAASVDTAATESARWIADLGPVFIVPGDTDRSGVAIHPLRVDADTSSVVRLARLGGLSAPIRVMLDADSVACGDAPAVRLEGAIPAEWTIGIGSPDVAPAALDSIESLPASDSAALAADIARLASGEASGSRFAGLPFVVQKAYRARHGDRTTIYANVVRRLPQEAQPLEQRWFLVAERPGSGMRGAQFSRRSEGTEETAAHFTLLAVLRHGDREIAIVEQEGPDGTQYGILERSPAGNWTNRWSRKLAC